MKKNIRLHAMGAKVQTQISEVSQVIQVAAGGSGIGVALSVGLPEVFSEILGIDSLANVWKASSQVSGEIQNLNAQTGKIVGAYGQQSSQLESVGSNLAQEATALAFPAPAPTSTSTQTPKKTTFPILGVILVVAGIVIFLRRK